MSARYLAVGWNRQKRAYDGVILAGSLLYLAVYAGLSVARDPDVTVETVLIRGFGTLGLLLLHVVLAIGPLCRLDPRFLPLLYNRRHLGIAMFVAALAHGTFALIQFHALGDVNPLVSVLSGDGDYSAPSRLPFQPLGLAALAILFLMAATSHDFWLANLTPPVWKGLHMLVYVAYALLVGHVALGALTAYANPVLAAGLGVGLVTIVGLHLAAARRDRALDRREGTAREDGYVDVCAVADVPEARACTAVVAGERIAVFRYEGKLSCVSNLCQHQNGPLGEGRIVDGCITCPWHGYQYLPASGRSPEPYTERIPTFRLKVERGRVLVDPRPNPPGTYVEPVALPREEPR